jgi:hypothetical protein
MTSTFFDGEMIFCTALTLIGILTFAVAALSYYRGRQLRRIINRVKKRIAIIAAYFFYPGLYKEYKWKKSQSAQYSERS